MAFSTLVANGAVGCTTSHELDGGVDAYVGAWDAAYGGVDASRDAPYYGADVPTYGGADASRDASFGGLDALYGGAPDAGPPDAGTD